MVAFLGIVLLAAAPVSDPRNPPVRDAAEHAADPRDRVICKRFLETGALVRGYRTCKTKAEWDRDRDSLRDTPSPGDSCSARGNGGAC